MSGGAALAGLLPVDKPEGPTSHDVVARARRLLGLRRVGHTGTLDPMASGLLLLALGPATRLIRFLPSEPKTYRGTLRLGRVTDTDDVTGAEIRVHAGPLPGEDAVRDVLDRLSGRILQRPPAVSAKKIAGVRSYRLARRGDGPRPEPVEVEVRWRSMSRPDAAEDPGLWTFEVAVSSGTYVRSLARDLGEALGCGGTLASLRRIAIGPLGVDTAATLPDPGTAGTEDDLSGRIVPLDALPLVPPEIRLADPERARRFAAGMAVEPPPADDDAPGFRTVRRGDGRLLGIGTLDGDLLRPRVVVARG